MAKHSFSGGTVELLHPRIMLVKFHAEHEVTPEDIKGITNIRKKLIGDREYCSLIDVTKDFLNFSTEAKEFIAHDEQINRLRKAEALLVRNKAQKLGVDLYIKLFNPKSDTRTFTSKEKAVEWLQSKIDELNIEIRQETHDE